MKSNPHQESRADKLATTVQQVGVGGGFYRLFKTLGFSALLIALALFFIYIEIPWYVGGVTIFIAIGIIVLDVLRLKRTARVNLNTLNEPVPVSIELEPGEILEYSIPAVMQYGKARSFEVLGTGKVLTPENALIITNKAVWALTIPLPFTYAISLARTDGKKFSYSVRLKEDYLRAKEIFKIP